MNEFGDDFLFDIAIDEVDRETMEWLGRQELYQEWKREQSEIMEKFPCVDNVLEGQGELFLTAEEHEAVVRYLFVRQKMDSVERREYYRFGHIHAHRYRNELTERNRHILGRINHTKECDKAEDNKIQWNHEDSPGWLDGFIERLDMIQTKKLEQNAEYQRLKRNEQAILQKHPIVLRLLEGDLVKSKITLSIEDQKAFEEYFSLQLHMDRYKELELYKIGQEDFLRYFNTLFC